MSYRRDMNSGRYNSDMNRGYDMGSSQTPMNPWNEGGVMNTQSGSGNFNDNATLLLANNLINNLIRNSNKMLPSLLDVNPTPPPMNNSSQGYNQNYGGMGMRQGGNNSQMFNRGLQNRAVGNRDYGHFNRNARPGPNNRSGNILPKKTNQFKKSPGNNKNNKAGYNANNKSKPNTPIKKRDPKEEVKPVATEAIDASTQETSTKVTDASSPKKNFMKNEFEGIEKQYFKCHICKKNMWDGVSFKKHLKGHAHLMMMDSISDSYAIRGQLIRHEIRVAENARQIETERKRRLGKGLGVNKQNAPVFCTMCDTQFTGTSLVLHRHSSGHTRLKQFLHPKCTHCDKEFATRIEWDEHLLSAAHLRKLNTLGVLDINDEVDELKEFTDQCEAAGMDMKKISSKEKSTPTDTKQETETNDTSDDKDGVKNDLTEVSKTDILLDYNETSDLTGVGMNQLPKYDANRPVGMSFVEERTCYLCNICHQYFANSETSAIHMKTLKHFDNYIKGLKRQLNNPKWNAQKSNKPEEEHVDDDNSGNWKRRKTEANNENSQEDGDMYDPSECLTEQAADEISKLMDDVVENEGEKETEVQDENKNNAENEDVKTTDTEVKTQQPEVVLTKIVEEKVPEEPVKTVENNADVQKETPEVKPVTVEVQKVEQAPPTKKPVNTPSRNMARGGPRSRRGTPRRY